MNPSSPDKTVLALFIGLRSLPWLLCFDSLKGSAGLIKRLFIIEALNRERWRDEVNVLLSGKKLKNAAHIRPKNERAVYEPSASHLF